MELPEHLRPAFRLLHEAYPQGVPQQDYLALLVVLQDYLSARNLAAVVAELVDGGTVVVENDAAAAAGYRRPRPAEVARVRKFLQEHGLTAEEYPANGDPEGSHRGER